jgi:hypothetical protein
VLSSLDFLKTGQQFPPDDPDTQDRFRMYERNKELFYGEHGKPGGIFDNDLKRLSRVVGNHTEVIDFVTLLNYHKLISIKTADLIFGEKPLISVEGEKDTIEQIEENTHMFNKFYQNIIDCSRYGNGIFDLYQDENFGNFDVGQPSLWIPIVDPNNYKKIINHVIAYMYEENDKKYLSAKVHYKGYFDKYLFEMGSDTNINKIMTDIHGNMVSTQVSSNTIGNLIETNRETTGLTDFAIQVTSNLITSDKITGCNDYDDINSLICALMVRVGQIEKILDKHSDPSVSAPSSAFQKDPETGEYTVKMGNAFIRDSVDDVEPKYITWEAQLEANFTQIEVLLNQLYVLSEMGATLLGGEDKGNSNMSGRALKFKMISPLAKAKRITMLLDPVIKNVIKLVSSLGGEGINDLTNEKITIKWQDGLPNDEFEESEIIEKRKNSNTMSTKRALMQYDNMDEDAAEEEIEAIMDEESQMNPMSEKPFSGDNLVKDDDNG